MKSSAASRTIPLFPELDIDRMNATMVPMSKSLEEQFREAVKEAREKIAIRLAVAEAALTEATDISDQFGVPFYASISPVGQSYEPESFAAKREAIAEELKGQTVTHTNSFSGRDYTSEKIDDLMDELECHGNEYGGGWEHSAVC